MTVNEDTALRTVEWGALQKDIHGDFKYTLRQFLLLRRHGQLGDWTDVCDDVSREILHHPDWDIEETDTYMNWESWYREQNAGAA